MTRNPDMPTPNLSDVKKTWSKEADQKVLADLKKANVQYQVDTAPDKANLSASEATMREKFEAQIKEKAVRLEEARAEATRRANEDPEVKADRERVAQTEAKMIQDLEARKAAYDLEKSYLGESMIRPKDEAVKLRQDLFAGKSVDARLKPESFWSRMKRNLFGNETSRQRVQDDRKKEERAIRESQERLKPGYAPKQEARPIEVVSPTSIHEIAGKSGVISARKEVASTTLEPRAQKKEGGFFNRLKSLFRKNDPYLNQAKFLDRPYAQESIKNLREGSTQKENELAEESTEQLGEEKAS